MMGPTLALLVSLSVQQLPPKLLDRENGGAVLDGLRWLRKNQQPDGSWGAKTSYFSVGGTGLALLAFLGADFTSESKELFGGTPFGETLSRGLSFLMDHQTRDGGFVDPKSYKGMFDDVLASLALSEAVRRTPTEKLKTAAQRSVDFLLAARNPKQAWRYAPRCIDNDSTVTGWALLSLQSAEQAGLSVSKEAIDEARRWIESVTDDKGSVGYVQKGQGHIYISRRIFAPHPTRTALAMLAVGHERINGLELLVVDPPEAAREKVDYLYWFLAAGAIRRASGREGKEWISWKTTLKPLIRRGQSDDGSWPAADEHSLEAGLVYSTAINTLCLELIGDYANVFTAPTK